MTYAVLWSAATLCVADSAGASSQRSGATRQAIVATDKHMTVTLKDVKSLSLVIIIIEFIGSVAYNIVDYIQCFSLLIMKYGLY